MTRPSFKRLMLAGALASLAVASQAAEPPQPRRDPARMEQRMAERQAVLKAELNLTPQQEAAWTTFISAMRPPQRSEARPDRAAFKAMTTPERLERLRAIRTERNAAMDQREQAILQFYGALTPEQQKVFDARTPRFGGHGGPGDHGPGGKHHHRG